MRSAARVGTVRGGAGGGGASTAVPAGASAQFRARRGTPGARGGHAPAAPPAHPRTARFPLRRQLEIERRIREGCCGAADALARDFEVDRRTILRDIEWLRDQMGAPVVWDRRRGQYRYDPPGWALPAVFLTEGEMVAVLLARRVLEEYDGTPWEADLRHAFDKLARLLPAEVSLDLEGVLESLAARVPAVRRQDLGVFRALVGATLECRRVRIAYRAAGRDGPESREVDPCRILVLSGAWYVIGRCRRTRQWRTFAVSRVEGVEATGATFPRASGFDLARYLGHSLGVHRGPAAARGPLHDVVLRFDAHAAGFVREEERHAERSRRDLPDGGLEVTLRLADLTEVTAWVLSWAGHVTVVAPGALRAGVEERLRRGLEVVAGGGR